MSRYYRSILNVQAVAPIVLDPDAEAFLTAAGITDATITSAINNLVLSLKADSLWTKMIALYPLVGGTAATHKFNLKDPRDLDAAFRLEFFGSPTHSANGMQGNASSQYANTHFNPFEQSVGNSLSISIYTNSILSSANITDISSFESGVGLVAITAKFTDGAGYFDSMNDLSNRVIVSPNDANGLLLVTKVSTSDLRAFANGSQIGSTVTTPSGSAPNFDINIMRLTGSVEGAYSNRVYQFAHIGEGLTPTEVANFNTSIAAFQTALTRNV
jgi:hypothetical protein